MNFEQKYKVQPDFDLSSLPTSVDLGISDNKCQRKLEKLTRSLSKFQDNMYAHNKYSVLICIQGMDTAGKDSLIREVFRNFNARGVVVQSFKKPNSAELEHDYLWRHYIALPERGKFTVFNRSHYENVLIARVHPQVVFKENIPFIDSQKDLTPEFWNSRYRDIINFEKHLSANGTLVLKFFLHLSKDQQKKRILRRLDKPKHQWKFSPEDINERQYWELYQEYYQMAIEKTHTKQAPWYVIPSDDKLISRYIFAGILKDIFDKMPYVKPPELSSDILNNLQKYKTSLLLE
ncbi:PPK2 family polyphosphate kinase [Myroides sp. LJL119]